MELKMIEGKAFEMMKERFEDFSKRIKKLCGGEKEKANWLDNEDVCRLLGISKRTLQSYRDRGTLAFSQIGHKCYYRPEDIEKLLSTGTGKTNRK